MAAIKYTRPVLPRPPIPIPPGFVPCPCPDKQEYEYLKGGIIYDGKTGYPKINPSTGQRYI